MDQRVLLPRLMLARRNPRELPLPLRRRSVIPDFMCLPILASSVIDLFYQQQTVEESDEDEEILSLKDRLAAYNLDSSPDNGGSKHSTMPFFCTKIYM